MALSVRWACRPFLSILTPPVAEFYLVTSLGIIAEGGRFDVAEVRGLYANGLGVSNLTSTH